MKFFFDLKDNKYKGKEKNIYSAENEPIIKNVNSIIADFDV